MRGATVRSFRTGDVCVVITRLHSSFDGRWAVENLEGKTAAFLAGGEADYLAHIAMDVYVRMHEQWTMLSLSGLRHEGSIYCSTGYDNMMMMIPTDLRFFSMHQCVPRRTDGKRMCRLSAMEIIY
jgi:hypothetical protein